MVLLAKIEDFDIEDLYKHSDKVAERESLMSKIFVMLKWPIVVAFVATLSMQFLLVFAVTGGSPFGVLGLLALYTTIIYKLTKRIRAGTEEERTQKILKELAKTRRI